MVGWSCGMAQPVIDHAAVKIHLARVLGFEFAALELDHHIFQRLLHQVGFGPGQAQGVARWRGPWRWQRSRSASPNAAAPAMLQRGLHVPVARGGSF